MINMLEAGAQKSPNTTFGATVRRLRQDAGLSIRRVAEAVGLSPTFMVDVEKDRRMPARDMVVKLAAVLDVPAERLETLGIPEIRVRARLSRRWITANPDLAARDRRGEQVFFVALYREQLTRPGRDADAVRRVDALTAWASATGARFAVAVDTQIWRCPQFLSNWAHVVRLLVRGRDSANPELGVLLCRACAKLGPSTIARLCAEFSTEDRAEVMASLLGEIHAGRLQADMSSARFSVHTIVSIP